MQTLIHSNVISTKAAYIFYTKFCEELIFLFDSFFKIYSVSCNKIYVAVSGGADSIALLYLLKQFLDEGRFFAYTNEIKIICLTVDHNLRVESKKDVKFVEEICESIEVECHSLIWNIKNTECVKKNKLENLARDVRYKLFEEFFENENNKNAIILTGHNLSDQLETFFIRKNMGSSNLGLACMSGIKTLHNNFKILRPLLKFYKQDLENYLNFQKISWIHDYMNDDYEFKRVFYRKNYNTHRKTDENNNIVKIINGHAQLRTAIEKKAVEFLSHNSCVEICNHFGFAKILYSKFYEIFYDDQCVASEFISRILWTIGGRKYKCNLTLEILKSLINKKNSTSSGCIIIFKKEFIYIFRENRNIPIINTKTPCKIVFDNRFCVFIKKNIGEVCIKSDYANHYLNKGVLKKIFYSFPCIYKNNIVVECDSEISECHFINKAGLFDIFI